jgi:NitT/TauT family transport system substrate-binding protein
VWVRRGFLGLMAGAMVVAAGASTAMAQDTVRIGLATKAWFPSLIAEAANSQGLFTKEGIKAELTVYQSGAEAFTALAAGAADVVSTSPNIIATGRVRGVKAKMVAMGGSGNLGWQLLVAKDSKIENAKELAGKKVGITSAGSLSDSLAQWTMAKNGVTFTTVPLGGGLAPNLINGNVDAAVVYSPLSYKILQEGNGRRIIDYGTAMPAHLNSGWAASDAFIDGKTDLLKKAVRALLGGVAYLQDNPAAAIKMIAEVNGISEAVAKEEYEHVFKKLSRTGDMTLADVEQAFELYRTSGLKELPPAADMFTNVAIPAKK